MSDKEINKFLNEVEIKPFETNIDNRKKIIDSISKMNIESLTELLEDTFTYNDLSKKDFLNELDVTFNDFKELGDSFFEVQGGKCLSQSCNTKGGFGLSFVGNTSRETLNLIFKEYNSEFYDIFTCSNFKLSNEKIIIKTKPSIDDLGLTQEDIDNLPF